MISDPDGVKALSERDAEIVAARLRYREGQAELDRATTYDCFAALDWAHNPGSN